MNSWILAKFPPSAGFPSPSGGVAPSAPRLVCLRRPFAAAFGGGKREINTKNWGAYGAHSIKSFRRVIRIPNMYLVFKLDNGKVVSIAKGQTESQNHRNIYYSIII